MPNIGLRDSGFISRAIIAIEVSDCDGNKVIEKCSFIFNKVISNIISKKTQELTLNLNTDLSLGCIVLDVGTIDYDLFEIQMADKLTSALEKAFLAYYEAVPKFPLDKIGSYQTRKYERQLMESRISDPSVQPVADTAYETTAVSEQSLIAIVEHYLQQGDWPTPSNSIPRLNNKESPFITQNLWTHVHRQPQQWLPMLAKYCLKPLGRRRLAAILSQVAQKALCRLLAEDNPESSIAIAEQFNHASMVKSEQLITAAEHYLRSHAVAAKGNLEAKPAAQPMGGGITCRSGDVLAVSNAGCLIFWPLLPTFFSIFDLLEKQVFISHQAQIDAVCLLDWLIWGDDEISDGRLSLNKVICGLPIHFEAAWCAPATEHKVMITEWLEKIREQLPVWKKMGVADIRLLFLQRPGEINWENSGVEIHVTPEAYDALIDNWPWPMNIAFFAWLQQPLAIEWL
ncbi:contractile injection system tape measure protein [Serratia fonticola]|uniref:Contractile injection system tape measure protein n=1 Tax=Serratia fonticola TaxID=47917 RepID=A0AAJ1YDD8_SERFO|nr:contractile injection system tape measure protein [Serratia fonticola]MDQ9128526.1 contractile injection system tape measure protein [Serratia fonticola]